MPIGRGRTQRGAAYFPDLGTRVQRGLGGDEEWNVSIRQANSIGADTLTNELGRLLDLVDAQAKRLGQKRSNQRRRQRRRLRATCSIRFLARDGSTVLIAAGKTRDISRSGLGLLTNRHLSRDAAVHVQVRLADGKEFNLAGEVAYVRAVKGEWCLIGVRFRKLRDELLLPPSEETSADAGHVQVWDPS